MNLSDIYSTENSNYLYSKLRVNPRNQNIFAKQSFFCLIPIYQAKVSLWRDTKYTCIIIMQNHFTKKIKVLWSVQKRLHSKLMQNRFKFFFPAPKLIKMNVYMNTDYQNLVYGLVFIQRTSPKLVFLCNISFTQIWNFRVPASIFFLFFLSLSYSTRKYKNIFLTLTQCKKLLYRLPFAVGSEKFYW